ncbi:hypothetical protein CkaCkLH20_00827 [Colletotrichum karsti]|uniref:FAD-binding PCMH-type domain-containing protein n=1 Tax=Colletotrichum karsti TaxID=1095194 RepID=A0A9P6IGK5_9PEZI|nr:uncharacterized protein CkaCkLH20_00827 [Colletotrichum karsti]KAF9881681.1 hypothetical protein CkaCkLH20_00827 [Colletotrichum karsti]
MTSLSNLKQLLRRRAAEGALFPRKPLSDEEYSAGFSILVGGPGESTYEEFILPQLSQLLAPLFYSRTHVSVLEIGPGPESVLERLPGNLRRKIKQYTAFEPNVLFAAGLEERLCSLPEPFLSLQNPPAVHRVPFTLNSHVGSGSSPDATGVAQKFDIILFCHSMYGMRPKYRYIEEALGMLVEQHKDGMVVVFHRDATMDFNGLVCQKTVTFPTWVTQILDSDEILDCFASFVSGFTIQDTNVGRTLQLEWREICRELGQRQGAGRLLFRSPEAMTVFTRSSLELPKLTVQVPSMTGTSLVKNREALLHQPATVMKPTSIVHLQQCIRWALNHNVSLTVVGGGHSGQCLWPGIVAIDMAAFNQVHVLAAETKDGEPGSQSGCLIVAEAGCKSGDIVNRALAENLTVPLGARPSVGAGLWLQGGIGHLARLHGLSCDAVLGAVMVSVDSGQVFCIGHVPYNHQPAGAVRPANEADLLWSLKGAGTNFGIVISVTFAAYAAPAFSVRNWVVPACDSLKAQTQLHEIGNVARKLPRTCSADMYLYWDNDRLHVGVTMFDSDTTGLPSCATSESDYASMEKVLGPAKNPCHKLVDSVGLFETEMYMAAMHGGHGGGKTSSFKRCLFLGGIGEAKVVSRLVAAIVTRPTPLCYLHLLQGGGAIGDVADNATAFGCRSWDYACVITGVWPREQDGTGASFAAVEWVYSVAENLLPLSCGAYGADLGPDPRDAVLARKAFGPNRPRLAGIKRKMDPQNVLAYACPLPKAPQRQRLILLVTGDSCAGKDYCADVWAAMLKEWADQSLTVRVASISDAFKREYAEATGADLGRLLCDRNYKEKHRPAMTTFFENQVRQRPSLPEEHFLAVVYEVSDTDVLLITGMRDEAPVATFSHLVPDSRMLEVHVNADERTWHASHASHAEDGDCETSRNVKSKKHEKSNKGYCPSFTFDNNKVGDEAARSFAKHILFPFLGDDLQRLSRMVRSASDFPRPGIDFRHVLGICQQPGGLDLCSTLLQTHFVGDWADVNAVVCCEAGGYLFAPVLASRVNVPLVLIREAGKLPPPTISVPKFSSHISSSVSSKTEGTRIEMDRDAVCGGESVVVVDDVLATGETMCAVLQLLSSAGVEAERICIMVVAEFPIHRGRDLLRKCGFGRVAIQSLLVFDGA